MCYGFDYGDCLCFVVSDWCDGCRCGGFVFDYEGDYC